MRVDFTAKFGKIRLHTSEILYLKVPSIVDLQCVVAAVANYAADSSTIFDANDITAGNTIRHQRRTLQHVQPGTHGGYEQRFERILTCPRPADQHLNNFRQGNPIHSSV